MSNEYKHIYNSRAWQKLRLLKLADEPTCRLCRYVGKISPARHIDHIIPMSKGGEAYEWENLQPLCVEHHSLKTAGDEGKKVNWGCNQDGTPADPKHHWNG